MKSPSRCGSGAERRRHVDEEAVERLGLLRRRQQVDVVARHDRLGLGRRQDLLVANDQRRLRPRRNEAAPEITGCSCARDSRPAAARADRADRVRRDAGRARSRGSATCSFRAARRKRPALQQQRDQHDDEGDVEIELGLRQVDQHRDRGQEDRHRAAQADP